MQFKHYKLSGATVAAELCNADVSALAYEAVLRDHRVDRGGVNIADVPAIETWLTHLRPVFRAPESSEKIELINGLMRAAGCRPRLVAHDGLAAHLHFADHNAALVDRVRAMTAGGLASAVAALGPSRLGGCENPRCGSVYLDLSRSGTRRHCSLRCANAVRVARHRRGAPEHP